MIRSIELSERYRSLVPSTFEEAPEFNRTNVVYGHNGSGKSSLSDLLLEVSQGSPPRGVRVDTSDSNRLTSKELAEGNPLNISVFNSTWVKNALGLFIEGDSAEAIVTLDETATSLKEESQELDESLPGLEKEHDDAKQALSRRRNFRSEVVTDAQDDIVREIDAHLPGQYTRSKFRVPRVEQLLTEHSGEVRTDQEQKHSRQVLATSAIQYFTLADELPLPVLDCVVDISELRMQTPTNVALESLSGRGELERWVETGLELHAQSRECMFCSGELSDERISELNAHFDASRREVREKCLSMRRKIDREIDALTFYRQKFPEPESVHPNCRKEYELNLANADAKLGSIIEFYETCVNLLDEKLAALDEVLQTRVISVPAALGTDELEGLRRNNALSQNIDSEKSSAAMETLDDVIGRHAGRFKLASDSVKLGEEELKAADDAVRAARARREFIRQQSYTSAGAAQAISRDLALVYGKNHLAIEIVGDGLSYRCVRDGVPAEHLSEGEKNTLALVYFMHAQTLGLGLGDKSSRVLVIDDPTSSFDRETAYATHSWLLDVVRGFGQVFILTHDFELLRLFLHSLSSRIARGDTDSPAAIPDARGGDSNNSNTASFLELRSVVGAQVRTSKLSPLSKTLVASKSEYSYLFEVLVGAVADDEDDASFFVSPNSARRVLETFCAFKAPNQGNFLSRLQYVIESTKRDALLVPVDTPVDYRSLYDFCNRFSHGQAALLGVSLDSATTRRELRNCLAFIRACDEMHYTEMLRSIASVLVDPLTGKPIPKPAVLAKDRARRTRARVLAESTGEGATRADVRKGGHERG